MDPTANSAFFGERVHYDHHELWHRREFNVRHGHQCERQRKIIATNVGVTGGASISGTASITPSVVAGMPPSVDPLAYLAQAAVPGTCDHVNYTLSGSGAITITPGTYCGGINVSVAGR